MASTTDPSNRRRPAVIVTFRSVPKIDPWPTRLSEPTASPSALLPTDDRSASKAPKSQLANQPRPLFRTGQNR